MNDRFLIIGAFATVYLVWGSTYLVNYLAIQQIPPFLMCGSRFFTAGTLLFITSLFFGNSLPSFKQIRNGGLLGLLFLSLGTGGVVWAEQYVDTSMAALIVAFTPLVIVLLKWRIRGQAPAWNSLFGIAIGVVGMLLLVGQPQLTADTQTLVGIIAIFLSLISWSFGTIYISDLELPTSKMQTASLQMISGGFFLLLASLLTGEYRSFSITQVSWDGWLAFLYLVFAGSILAFSAFNYLLAKVAPEQVSTSNYVNPVVAMFLGWSLNHEKITGQSLIAATLLLTGVLFINSRLGKRLIKQKNAEQPTPREYSQSRMAGADLPQHPSAE
jgi:drug/metabolite transporter (DMT)-like permease